MMTFWNFKIPIIVVLLCFVTTPCLGHDPIQIIGTGGTCFIGESGLDVSEPVPVPGTQIGWWVSAADVGSTAPSMIIQIQDPLNFFVDPNNFVGYTGTWYVLPEKTVAFIVQDPSLDLSIDDVTIGTDITNAAIIPGDEIGFKINSNLYGGDPGTPIAIKVISPSGSTYTTLVNKTGIETSLNDILVSSQPFHTGGIWDTLNNTYALGEYTIRAECNLNGMKDNYKMDGQDYIGKTVSPNRTISLLPEPGAPTRIGLFRNVTQMWYLDYDNSGASDFKVKWGDEFDKEVAGDWDGDDIDEIGLFRPSTQMWYLDYNNDGLSDYRVRWGDRTDKPVVGDWDGDNKDEIGLFRNVTQTWYLDYDNNGLSDYRVKWGDRTDKPVVGDWDGDNKDEIGLFRNVTQTWYLDYDNNGLSDYRIKWGDRTDRPVAGDWDKDGKDEIGLFRQSTQMWYLDYDNNGLSNFKVRWGDSTDFPVAGKWS